MWGVLRSLDWGGDREREFLKIWESAAETGSAQVAGEFARLLSSRNSGL